ncbi:hypothetical protein K9N08_02030 [Candidatus Gracilibacteria bacterium]|nr:hypothetical protein [Candidatus Gracilibacteria bacterium]MCF7856317.1 hypothetical protein [Candidatus Gracilibacteria bacterium]MCF7896672.1 hypothetical protein [Candidatus Gracilibacteria bacterium]
MKTGYLIGAVVITVLLLTVSFRNLQTSVDFETFFGTKNASLGFSILTLVSLGIAAGSLYTLAIRPMFSAKPTEEPENKSSEL